MVDMTNLELRMEKSIESLKHNLAGLRTGRASANLVDGVNVEVYGSMMPLSQVATVSVPEPRMITLSVWDKSNVQAVEKAIMDSNLGINPSSDGTLIRLPIPDLNEERRKEMVKMGGKFLEDSKISIRNIRRDGNDSAKKAEKNGDISKDDMHAYGDEIQQLTDKYIGFADEEFKRKEDEIMTV